MTGESITDAIDRQEWLDTVGDGLGSAVEGAFKAGGGVGGKIKNFLHGTWLGHPLHPVLTDIPLGAWTAALVLDIAQSSSGDENLARGADAAVGIGLVGALGAAVAGLTDWQSTDDKARRVGLAHGLLNISATLLYTASWLLRRRDARNTAKGLSLLGFSIAAGSAYLGGQLVYGERIGVDHAVEEEPPEKYTPVLAAEELPEGKLKRVEADGTKVLLVRRGDQIYALIESCSHLGGPLSEGELEDNNVRCPWHGSCFALEDGHVIDGPATHPQPRLEARIRKGQIEVRAAKKG